MAVQWQTREIPLGVGVDTKTADEAAQDGQLSDLQNAVFTRGGILRRRNGYTNFAGGALSSANALGVFNGELVAQANGEMQSWSPGTSGWLNQGPCRSVPVASQTIAQETANATYLSCASLLGLTLYVWRSGVDSCVHIVILDEVTGAFVCPVTAIDTHACDTVTCAADTTTNRFVIAYRRSGGSLVTFQDIQPTNPVTLSGPGVSGISTRGQIKLIPCSQAPHGLAIAYRYETDQTVRVSFVNYLGAIDASSVSIGSTYTTAAGALNVVELSSGVAVFYENASGDLYGTRLDAALAITVNDAFIDSVSSHYCAHVAIALDANDRGSLFYDWYPTSPSPGYNRFTRYVTIDPALNTGLSDTLFYGVSVASDAVWYAASPYPWVDAGGSPHTSSAYVWVKYYTSTLVTSTTTDVSTTVVNSGYFLVNLARCQVGRALMSRAGDTAQHTEHLPPLATRTAPNAVVGDCLAALAVLGDFDSSSAATTLQIAGVARVEANLAAERPRMIQIGQNLLVAGGGPSEYDGSVATEAGFPIFPEQPTAVSVPDWQATHLYATGEAVVPTVPNGYYFQAIGIGVSGGSEPTWNTSGTTTDGSAQWRPVAIATTLTGGAQYTYYTVFEWIDAKGQLHESPPSPPAVVTMSGSDITLLGQFPLSLTRRFAVSTGTFTTQGTGVRVAVYRTAAGATVPHKVGYFNNVTSGGVTLYFIDQATDAVQSLGSVLYTAGGELPNEAPPPCTMLASLNQRLYAAGLEDPFAVAVSKQSFVEYGLGWSSALRFRVDPAGGAVTALAAMDGRLVVFQAERISLQDGSAPDNLGAGFFNPIQPLATDVGCSNPDSVVLTPMGVVFQSQKGIYLLGRDLQVNYIGAPVESYNSQTITSAVLVPNTTQVRFLSRAGTTLVWDYLFHQWGTFSNHQGVDSVAWGTHYVYLRNNGVVAQEDSASYVDPDATRFNLALTTAWIRLDGIDGFARFRKIVFTETYYSVHHFSASMLFIAHGVQSSYSWSTLFAPVITSGNSQQMGLAVPAAAGKCSAFKLTLTEGPDATGQDFALTGLAIQYGTKGGLSRLPAANRT